MTDFRFQHEVESALASMQRKTEVHPNADLLNAFRERRLASPARDAVAGHLAGCGTCREMLAVSGFGVRAAKQGPRLQLLRLAAVAALVLAFATVLSRVDRGALRLPEVQALKAALSQYAIERSPIVSYASVELSDLRTPLRWRISRLGVLESSSDGGRLWKVTKLENGFEPKAVGVNGLNVWVTGRSGDMLVSRDSGRRWVHLRPAQAR